MANKQLTNCFYVDLAGLPDEAIAAPKNFDGMAPGEFITMSGDEVVIIPDDLLPYTVNTKIALASTKDAAGNVVGFPIDGIDHRGGFAAGWITDVNLAMGRTIIEFTPRWTADGLANIQADRVRYFSPTFDPDTKTILGGSMTNWPATRTQEHQMLLHPVELGSSILVAEPMEKKFFSLGDSIKNIISGVLDGLRGAAVQPDIVDNERETIMTEKTVNQPVVDLASPEVSAEIDRQVTERVNAKLAAAKRDEDTKTFVAQLSAGNGKMGLAIDAEKMTAFLAGLSDPTPAMEILKALATAERVDFSEHGTGKIITGAQPLPDAVKPALLSWINGGLSIAEFFKVNSVELGAMEDYNLAEYQPKVSN